MKKINIEQSGFPLSDQAKKEIEFKMREEKLVYEIKEELYCLDRYRIFFDHYNEESIHAFIDEFAKRKAYYVLNGQHLLDEEENGKLYFRNLAGHFIWQIQQKKLFDLQCLWRAGELDMEEISVTKDFLLFETQIRDCKLIDEISEVELKIFIEYILSDDYSEINHAGSWQNYERIKAGDSMLFSTVPAWYEFYDRALRKNSLHLLPNKKGDKEKFYLDLSAQSSKIISTKEKENEQPDLKFNYESLEFFIRTFEDSRMAKYFYAAEKNHPEINYNGELNEALYLLQLSDERIPVQPGVNWKEAIINAAKHFKKNKIADALQHVFDEYKIRLAAGIPFCTENDLLRQQIVKADVEKYKKQILKARQRNGEPEDFKY